MKTCVICNHGSYLHCRVVGVLVGYKVGTLDLAPVRVGTVPVEYLLVQVHVVNIDSTVERDHNHLGHVCGFDSPWDTGTVG